MQSVVFDGDEQVQALSLWLTVVWVFVFHIVLLCWQIVGVLRAADSHFSQHGTMAVVWAVQLVSVLLFIHTLLAVFESSLSLQDHSLEQARWDDFIKQNQSQYTVSFDDRNQAVVIEGIIELGLSGQVRKLLSAHPNTRRIHLHSDGGNIFEARALAKLFKAQSLNTHVEFSCASACSMAYLGGLHRTVLPQAKLGFHQYRVDASYRILATNAKKEQERDAGLYQDAGVSLAFVKSVFSQPANSMWWPSHEELLSAGVIHSLP